MTFTIEFEREDDGRWLAEVVELPGVLAYGKPLMKPLLKLKLSLCAFWQTGLNMAKVLLSL